MTVSARELCEQLQIKARDLEVVRRDILVREEDYTWDGKWQFLPSGVAKVREWFNTSESPPVTEDELEEAVPAPVAPVGPEVLRVERICPNPRWVECRREGRLVPVRVQNNAWLRRGQPVTVLPDGDGRWFAVRVRG